MNGIKGVVLAGGLGTRLQPMTKVTNKHCLPVGGKPMVYYPLQTLADALIKDVMVVTGGHFAGSIMQLIGNGKQFGFNTVYYAYQEGEGGIADALKLCESWADGDKIVVILGDNYFADNLLPYVVKFKHQDHGARILLKQVEHAERFGVATLPGDGSISCIKEKPLDPDSRFAVTGCYMYDSTVFDYCRTLEKSARGELEITDVNNAYIQDQNLQWDALLGFWTDMGTVDSLEKANLYMSGGKEWSRRPLQVLR